MAVLYRFATQVEGPPERHQLLEVFRSWWGGQTDERWDVTERRGDGLWVASASVDSSEQRLRASLTLGDEGRDKWLWFELNLPDHIVCQLGDLQPAPKIVAELLDGLEIPADAPQIQSPHFLRTEDELDQAIARSRSLSMPTFFFTAAVEADGLTRTQEVLWDYVEGLGEVFVIPLELFEHAKPQLGLRWSNPGAAVCTVGRRTRQIPGDSMGRRPEPAARRLQSYGLSMADCAVPASIVRRRRILEIATMRETGDRDELLAMIEQQMADLEHSQAEVARLQSDLESSIIESIALQEELAESGKAIKGLRWRIDHPSETAEPSDSTDDILALGPSTCTDVLRDAAVVMDNLLITADLGTAEALDVHEHTEQWAIQAWGMLAAANDYVDAKQSRGFAGDLYRYAVDPPPSAVPLSAKRVTLKESESTEINRTLRGCRTFVVPEVIDASGRTYMGAHFKISSGSPAPRIHFYDASSTDLGKIVVGYFGPHLPTGGD